MTDANNLSPAKPMIAHESGFIGQGGINLIATVVNQMRHLWTPTPQQSDLGIDGYIELCDDTPEGKRKGTGFVVRVQSKATANEWPQETSEGFVFRDVSERALQYWLASNDPVILVVSRPSTNEAYWVSIKHYFKSIESRRNRTVLFRKQTQRFDASVDLRLRELAVPPDAGIKTDPLAKVEALECNLLPVLRYPPKIYSAPSRFTKFESIQKAAKKTDARLTRGWFLKHKRIFSFRPLTEAPWPAIRKGNRIDEAAAASWANSDDPVVMRDFVRLLNEGLASYLGGRGLWKFKLPTGRLLYFFAPAEEGIERKLRWGERDSERGVVQKVHAKHDPTRVICYRHNAIIPQFERFAGKWYLVAEPTYHFTKDGENAYSYREEYLAGMKRLEKHLAVSNNVRFWVHFLTHVDLLEQRDDMLAFGKPAQFTCDYGIPDADWFGKADEDEKQRVGTENEATPAAGKLIIEPQLGFTYET